MRLRAPCLVVTFVFSICYYSAISSAQTASSNDLTERKFSKGFIVTKERKWFRGKNLVFGPQILSFEDQKTAQQVTLPLSEIQYVRAKVGNYAGEGAVIGAGIFFLAALEALLDVSRDPYTKIENGPEVVMISTAIGFTGGLIAGAFVPKERIVYKTGRFR